MGNPMIKQMLVPFINEEKTGIRFGGHQAGITRDIEVDDPETFFNFIKLMDGTKTISELANITKVAENELVDIIKVLKEASVVYDNDSKEFDFSREEVTYYSRNINFFAWIDVTGEYYNYWEVQSVLKNSHVLLLGAGGTGSSCGKTLARLGVGEISILDCDLVELSNLNRQEYFWDEVGKSKVQSLKDTINRINPFITINTFHKKINRYEDLLTIDNNYDVVIVCIDKPKNIYEIIEEYIEYKGIPWILGGYASTILTNAIFYKGDTKCTDIFNKSLEESFEAKKLHENNQWKWENAIISPVSQISGNFSALYAFYWLTKLNSLEGGMIKHIDLFNLQTSDFTYTIKEDSVC